MARVYLTGGLRVDGPRGSFVDADLPGSQGRIAFAALAVERRPLSRDALAEIVWGDRLPSKWEGALATLVSKIRTLLTHTGLDGKALVTAAGGEYSLVFPAHVWVDLEDALRRLDRADGALRHGDVERATVDGTVAASILRRPFLPGIGSDWAEDRRRILEEALYRCSVVLARAWIERGDPVLAAVIAEAAIRADPLREIGYRLLMTAEWRRGDRGAALRSFAECERVLRTEFGADPSPETLALLRSIRA